MSGIFESIIPTIGEGDVAGISTKGPWFNWKGARAECDWINWEDPSGTTLRIQLTIPCPRCGFPQSFPASTQLYRVGSDGELSFGAIFRCPAHWQARDESGHVKIGTNGGPVIERCATVIIIREGVAHHPQCRALHHPNCAAFHSQQCNCGQRWGGMNDCNCGAIVRR